MPHCDQMSTEEFLRLSAKDRDGTLTWPERLALNNRLPLRMVKRILRRVELEKQNAVHRERI